VLIRRIPPAELQVGQLTPPSPCRDRIGISSGLCPTNPPSITRGRGLPLSRRSDQPIHRRVHPNGDRPYGSGTRMGFRLHPHLPLTNEFDVPWIWLEHNYNTRSRAPAPGLGRRRIPAGDVIWYDAAGPPIASPDEMTVTMRHEASSALSRNPATVRSDPKRRDQTHLLPFQQGAPLSRYVIETMQDRFGNT